MEAAFGLRLADGDLLTLFADALRVLAAAFVALPAASGLGTELAVAFVIGVGRGVAAAGSSPFTAQLARPVQRRAAFARQSRAMNVGLGLGALAASVLVAAFPLRAMPVIFVVNGLTFLPIAIFMVRRAGTCAQQPTTGPRPGSPRNGGLLVLAGPVTVIQFAVSFFGYSQFEATTPLVAHRLSGGSLGFVSVVVAGGPMAQGQESRCGGPGGGAVVDRRVRRRRPG